MYVCLWPVTSRIWGVTLEQSRHMLVLLGAPVSHTISTSEALLRADAWTSIDSCLLLVGAPVSYTISTNEALVLSDAWTSIGSRLVMIGDLAGTTSESAEPWCAKVPRAI